MQELIQFATHLVVHVLVGATFFEKSAWLRRFKLDWDVLQVRSHRFN